MNFVHLVDVFEGKCPNEIYELLCKATETFVDIDSGTVSNEPVGKRIVLNDKKNLDLGELNRQVKISRDLYENLVASLSWKNLDLYLGELDHVEDMEHAAFIIDIATRNCIPLRQHLYTDMLRFRNRSLFIQYRQAWLKMPVQEIHREANEQTLKLLNVLVHRDAYVRY